MHGDEEYEDDGTFTDEYDEDVWNYETPVISKQRPVLSPKPAFNPISSISPPPPIERAPAPIRTKPSCPLPNLPIKNNNTKKTNGIKDIVSMLEKSCVAPMFQSTNKERQGSLDNSSSVPNRNMKSPGISKSTSEGHVNKKLALPQIYETYRPPQPPPPPLPHRKPTRDNMGKNVAVVSPTLKPKEFVGPGSPSHKIKEPVGIPTHQTRENFGPPTPKTKENFGHPTPKTNENFGHPSPKTNENFGHPTFKTNENFGPPAHKPKENFGPPTPPITKETFGPPAHKPKENFGPPIPKTKPPVGTPMNKADEHIVSPSLRTNEAVSLSEVFLNKFPWYHGKMDRVQAERRLNGTTVDGCFLVRERLGNIATHPMAISLVYNSKVYHLEIRIVDGGKYAVGCGPKPGEMIFDGVDYLVNYYRDHPLHLVSRNGNHVNSISCSTLLTQFLKK